MPSYKVESKGFIDAKTYYPGDTLHRDKPFTEKTMPSWVTPIKDETAAQKKKRLAAEKKQAKAAADKAAADKKDVNEVTFDQTSEHKTESL